MTSAQGVGKSASTPCTLCKTPGARAGKRIRSPYVQFDYTLYTCDSCGSAFFDVDEHEIDLEAVYEVEAATKSQIYEDEFRPSRYWSEQKTRIQKAFGKPVQSVLDVGCRTGDFLLHWPADIQRVGVELSERSAGVATRRGLKIHQDYLERVEFNRQFEVVTCFAVIEHLPQPIDFLRRLSVLVAPGGVLAILIPTRQCFKRWLLDLTGHRWHMYSPPQHLNYMSREILDNTLVDCGFELIERKYTSGGMFNPLRRIPVANKIASRVVEICDSHLPTNRIPVFDHLYSYYRKEIRSARTNT